MISRVINSCQHRLHPRPHHGSGNAVSYFISRSTPTLVATPSWRNGRTVLIEHCMCDSTVFFTNLYGSQTTTGSATSFSMTMAHGCLTARLEHVRYDWQSHHATLQVSGDVSSTSITAAGSEVECWPERLQCFHDALIEDGVLKEICDGCQEN